MNEDREARAARTNEVVRRRYATIVERFQTKLATKLRAGTRIRTD
jgi:hypothetical protein